MSKNHVFVYDEQFEDFIYKEQCSLDEFINNLAKRQKILKSLYPEASKIDIYYSIDHDDYTISLARLETDGEYNQRLEYDCKLQLKIEEKRKLKALKKQNQDLTEKQLRQKLYEELKKEFES